MFKMWQKIKKKRNIMIQANELRVNNYVEYKWFEKTSTNGKQRTEIHREHVQILAIDGQNKRALIKPNQTRKNHTWVSLDAISPVTLTEDTLLKCGFERKSYLTEGIVIEVAYYQIENIVIYLLRDFFFEIEIITPSGQFNLIKQFSRKLHQLQNIIYLLNGQELEFNK